jgi:MoaA/NifB/PqqE/SkfB family radical SAM enzyme
VDRSYFEEFEMDLVGHCNLKCPLCTRNYLHGQHLVKDNVRPLSEIIKQLDTFPNLKRTFLAGTLSEPTLHPEFLDYLRYIKGRGIYVELYSNASAHNTDFWKEVGEILDDNDQVHFTICGSTDALHQTYRINSKLDKVLENAAALRSVRKIDYCQFIRFVYNKDDEENVKKFPFTHYYTIETEGIRRLNKKITEPLPGVEPLPLRDKLIKQIFNNRPKPDDGKKYTIRCKSLEDKKIYIDQFGNITACYIHREYEPQDIFTGDEFDYSDILDFKYQDCFLCEKRTRHFIERMGLDFVC